MSNTGQVLQVNSNAEEKSITISSLEILEHSIGFGDALRRQGKACKIKTYGKA